MFFYKSCDIRYKHVKIKFLHDRDGCSTIERLDIQPFLELIVFTFDWPYADILEMPIIKTLKSHA